MNTAKHLPKHTTRHLDLKDRAHVMHLKAKCVCFLMHRDISDGVTETDFG